MQSKITISKEEMSQIPAEEICNSTALYTEPLVSVVMMTRNHEDYIRQAVQSVLDQEVDFPIEILIGEDFSTDNTRQECEKLQQQYPQVIRLIVAGKNVGITPNFLRLACRARGKYIALLEGDDYWTHPQKLSLQVALMEQHPDYSWCAGKTEARQFWVKEKEFYSLGEIIERYLFHTSTFFFRSELLNTYPEFPNSVCWDAMLSVYLSTHGKCGFINQYLSFYRRHEGGLYTGDSTFNRIKLAHLFSDVINSFTDKLFSQEIFSKELWICSMETSINLETYNLFFWKISLRILYLEYPRLALKTPILFLLFSLKIVFQPLIFIYLYSRRKLAIKSRLLRIWEILSS